MLNITDEESMGPRVENTSITKNVAVPSALGMSEVTTVNNVIITTDNSKNKEDIVAVTTEVMVLSAIALSLLILVGVAGNVMTILAYLEDRQHNKVYDFFIINLAITDLMICSFSMPVYTVYTLMEYTWPFGYWFCKIWMLIDYTACTETTLLIVILSLDRLVMISLGPFYMRKVTWKFAKTVIVISWIISIIYYGPAIMFWNYWVGYSIVEYMDCDVEFAFANAFVIAISIGDFVLPAVGLTIINGLLFYKIWRWTKRKQAFTQKPNSVQAIVIPNEMQKISTCSVAWETIHQIRCGGNLIMAVLGITSTLSNGNFTTRQSKTGTCAKRKTKVAAASNGKVKSAKCLAILVIAFVFFWSPFTITTMVISICKECINKSLYEFFIWLVWVKSVVNPLLYAFNNPRYRQCFMRYMTLNGRIWISGNQRP